MAKYILHIVSSLKVGGAEKFVKNLSIEQDSRGLPVRIISFGQTTDSFQPIIEEHGIEVINLKGGIISRLIQFIKLLNQSKVIHIHSPSVIRAFLPVFPFLLLRTTIYTIHGEVDPPQNLLYFSHQVARLYLDKVAAVSKSAKKSVYARYGWQSSDISVIKNGVAVPEQTCPLLTSEKICIGIVSRLIPLKNIGMLFYAIRSLRKELASRISVEIYGDGPELEVLQNLSKTVESTTTVKFHGNVVDEREIFCSIDLLVMCSDTEGLPMSILEAMGYGRPVVSTNVGAISKVINDNVTGWLYEAKSTSALTEHLQRLILSPDEIKHAGKQAKIFIREHYAIATIFDDYQQLYAR